MFKDLKFIFSPNKSIGRQTLFLIAGFQLVLFIGIWMVSPGLILPKPNEIIKAVGELLGDGAVIGELMVSLTLSVESMGIAVLLSLLISYLSVLPFFRPTAFVVTKLRFLTLVGLSTAFTLILGGGHGLKVTLMVFGITVFFVTNMMALLNSIPKYEFNHARTLQMSEWEIVKEVIILGKFDQVFDLIRQNFAIGWMMLTMVEGISRSEGGIGVMLLNYNKHFQLDKVFAIQLIIILVGILMDYLIGLLKNLFCPYASLSVEKR